MSGPARAPRAAVRVLAAALRLLPRRLRDDYADEMIATYEERCREAASRGGAALAVALAGELRDLAVTTVRARRRAAVTVPATPRRRMSAIIHDLRHAARMLRRQRAFTVIAALTLGIGIGVTTAVFTVVNGVLLRPLPYAEPDRLVLLLYGSAAGVSPWLSPLNYRDYVAESGVFDRAAALTPTTANVTGGGDPERVRGVRVTPGFFDVLGVRMTLGRAFIEQDAQPGSRAVILSDGLWRRRFAGRRDIVGSTVTLDGDASTIIGVAPPGVSYPATAEFWRPLIFEPRDVAPEARGAQFVQVIARLKPGLSADDATRAIGSVAARFAKLYPTEDGSVAQATLLQDRIVRTIRPTLRLLLIAVSFVLAIACANVAGLLLARGSQRGREIGVRVALGAGRGRLMGQLLTESLLLGLLGIATGVAIASWLVTVLIARAPAGLPRLADARIDLTVLAFAVVIGLVTSVVFGLIPAVFTVGGGPAVRVAGGTRGQVGSSGPRMRRVLVAVEIALAVVLLAGAGLLLRSYTTLRHVAPGFDDRQVLTFQLSLPSSAYPDGVAADAFMSRLLTGLRARPEVDASAAAMGVPFGADLNAMTMFSVAGDPPPPSSAHQSASLRIVSRDYFKTMTIPVARGRAFTDGDSATGPEVVIVNERFAQRYFGGRDPIGRQILVSVALARGARNGPKTIVGVAGNVKYGGLDEETPAEIYEPYAQEPVSDMTVVIKSAADPRLVVPEIRREVAALDPTLPLANLKPLAELVDASVAARRFAMLLVVLFAVVALGLSAVGLYGVLAHLVATRSAEVGLRLALGASERNVVWLFLQEGLWLTLAGLAAGLFAARASASLIATSLVGVTASDPATLVSVAATLGIVALGAIAVPVWRATRIDPATLLRE